MGDENWKEEFRQWKPDLKPYQIKLLEEGPNSNSQTLMLSDMWLEWKELSAKRELQKITSEKLGDLGISNPWDENEPKEPIPSGYLQVDIDEQLLKKVKPLTQFFKEDLDKGSIAKQRLNNKNQSR